MEEDEPEIPLSRRGRKPTKKRITGNTTGKSCYFFTVNPNDFIPRTVEEANELKSVLSVALRTVFSSDRIGRGGAENANENRGVPHAHKPGPFIGFRNPDLERQRLLEGRTFRFSRHIKTFKVRFAIEVGKMRGRMHAHGQIEIDHETPAASTQYGMRGIWLDYTELGVAIARQLYAEMVNKRMAGPRQPGKAVYVNIVPYSCKATAQQIKDYIEKDAMHQWSTDPNMRGPNVSRFAPRGSLQTEATGGPAGEIQTYQTGWSDWSGARGFGGNVGRDNLPDLTLRDVVVAIGSLLYPAEQEAEIADVAGAFEEEEIDPRDVVVGDGTLPGTSSREVHGHPHVRRPAADEPPRILQERPRGAEAARARLQPREQFEGQFQPGAYGRVRRLREIEDVRLEAFRRGFADLQRRQRRAAVAAAAAAKAKGRGRR